MDTHPCSFVVRIKEGSLYSEKAFPCFLGVFYVVSLFSSQNVEVQSDTRLGIPVAVRLVAMFALVLIREI